MSAPSAAAAVASVPSSADAVAAPAPAPSPAPAQGSKPSGAGGGRKKSKSGAKHTTPSASSDTVAAGIAPGNIHAPTHGHPTPAAMLALLGDRIDTLEDAAAAGSDDASTPSAEDQAAAEQLVRDTQAKLAGMDPAEQVRALTAALRSEATLRATSARLLAQSRDRLQRCQNQKRSLEGLCKELQVRNRKLGDDIRQVSEGQAQAHREMQERFSRNLADIQAQIDKQSADRLAQAKENDGLREKLGQLLKFDALREEQMSAQMKSKELELKLAEAKLAQQSEFAAAEAKKTHAAHAKLALMEQQEAALRAQLATYAEKFESVQETLSKSNALFANFKSDMERTAAQLRTLEKAKAEAEKKNAAAQLSVIQMMEERQADAATMEKLRRQVLVLSNLCKTLEAKKSATTEGTPAADKSEEQQQSAGESAPAATDAEQ